jgi:translin
VDLTAVGDDARAALEGTHRAREAVLRTCRSLIQASAAAIRATHREDWALAEERLAEAAGHLAAAEAALDGGHHEVRHAGFLHDAAKEYAEARLTLAFVRGDALPSAAELGVSVPAYLNGMAEAASELRRRLLDLLRRDDLPGCERLLRVMDDVYGLCVTVDYPDAVTGGLRRTTDALRAVLERTRGDLTSAIVQHRLRVAIERVEPGGVGTGASPSS